MSLISDSVFRSTDNGTSWNEINSGLPNVDAYSLAASNSALFAGTHSGVFRSIDNGTNWTRINSSFKNFCSHLRTNIETR